jgi:hypothetical protein
LTVNVTSVVQPVTAVSHHLRRCVYLLDVGLVRLEVLASDKVGDVIIIVIVLLLAILTLLLLHALVALSELAERGERIGPKLVEDAGNKLRKLLVLAVAVDGECVGGY